MEGHRRVGAFVYTPPVLGRPVGQVPSGYVRPEWRENEQDVEYETDSEVDDDSEDESTTDSAITIHNSSSEGTITSANTTTTDASTDSDAEVMQPEIIKNWNAAYGLQPDVVDGRFVEDVDIHGPVQAAFEGHEGLAYDVKDEVVPSSQSSSGNSSFTLADSSPTHSSSGGSQGSTVQPQQEQAVFINLISD